MWFLLMNKTVTYPVSVRSCARFLQGAGSWQAAFTLLEVLIALAILAIGYSALLGSQARSLASATEAKFNTQAPLLADSKLAELKSNWDQAAGGEGDFGDDFPGFTWKFAIEDADIGDGEAMKMNDQPLQRVDLTIAWANTGFTYTVTYYGFPEKQ